MKKVIAIAVVIVVALVGLTSYNGSGEKKEKGHLLAELKSGGTGVIKSGDGGTKKLD